MRDFHHPSFQVPKWCLTHPLISV